MRISYQTFLLVFTIMLGIVSGGYAQSKKKQAHAEERIEADALAFAYISCKYELTKYKSEQEENDKQLKKQLRTDYDLFTVFNVKTNVKYKYNPDVYNKYQRYYKSAWKELTVCKKYQNLLDALEEIEKNSN